MITKNVHLLPARPLSAWRKISLGSWRPNGDSQVYAEIVVDAGPALRRITELNKTTQTQITLTHFMGKVLGKVLAEVPDLNAVVRFGKIYPRRDVDVFFHVAYAETELSGHVVRGIERKPCRDIASELTAVALKIKKGEDVSFEKIKASWRFIPGFLARPVLDLIGFLSYSLNLNIHGSGIPRDCFGSVMITNIGSLGFTQAFVPIPPYTRVPLILALGRPELRPCSLPDGSVVSREQVSLNITFDHRIMDGARGAKMAFLLKKFMRHPELID